MCASRICALRDSVLSVMPASGVVLGSGPWLTGPRRLGGSTRVLQVLRVFHSGGPLSSSTRGPGAPLPLCSCLVVVDRTLCACPVTCSSWHLTSHLFHSYISTTHSLRPQGFASFLSCLFSVSTGYEPWALKTTRESS